MGARSGSGAGRDGCGVSDEAILTPPRVCGRADVRLAHELMRQHRVCRADRCIWKSAAYYTLVAAGHLAPQTLTPRERAAARNIAFPRLDAQPPVCGGPPLRTLREVLERLSELAVAVPDSNGTADQRN